MKERKIVELKMKFYEDELDDFLAMIYIMKSELKDEAVNHSTAYRFDMEKNESKLNKGSIGVKCEAYEKTAKPFLRFLHWISCRFHIPTLDGGKDVKDEFLQSGMTENDYFQETLEFLIRSNSIKRVFNKDQMEKLTSHLCRIRDIYRPKKEEKDIFLEATRNFEGSDIIPDDMFDFYASKYLADDRQKRDIRVCYEKTMSREEKYVLARAVFERVYAAVTHVAFDEDFNPIGKDYKEKNGYPLSDYQMYVLTGYIMSDFNFSYGKIKTEEEHLERDKAGYIKPYRDYLAGVAGNWIKNGDKNTDWANQDFKFTPVRQKF
ncbi:MAG: hypothetical protein ACI85O_003641 [Saprospiraceae bacterium]|jgi:hypothetical protein